MNTSADYRPLLSIVVPAYNEEATLAEITARLLVATLAIGVAGAFAFWLWVENTPALILPEISSPGAGVYVFDRYDQLIDRLNGEVNSVPVALSNHES